MSASRTTRSRNGAALGFLAGTVVRLAIVLVMVAFYTLAVRPTGAGLR